MRPTHRHFACTRFVREAAWTEDGPFERGSLAESLVRLVFPLHPQRHGVLQPLGRLQVLFVLSRGERVSQVENGE